MYIPRLTVDSFISKRPSCYQLVINTLLDLRSPFVLFPLTRSSLSLKATAWKASHLILPSSTIHDVLGWHAQPAVVVGRPPARLFFLTDANHTLKFHVLNRYTWARQRCLTEAPHGVSVSCQIARFNPRPIALEG